MRRAKFQKLASCSASTQGSWHWTLSDSCGCKAAHLTATSYCCMSSSKRYGIQIWSKKRSDRYHGIFSAHGVDFISGPCKGSWEQWCEICTATNKSANMMFRSITDAISFSHNWNEKNPVDVFHSGSLWQLLRSMTDRVIHVLHCHQKYTVM